LGSFMHLKTNQMKNETKSITIEEDWKRNITVNSVNNFVNWRKHSGVNTLDELLVQLLFSHLKVSDEKLSNNELIELEQLIKFVRDQRVLEEEK
jgi:hypothetical protein